MKKLDKKLMMAVAAGSMALGGGSLFADESSDEELLRSGALGRGQDVRESLMDINDQQSDEDYLAFWWLWDDDDGPDGATKGAKDIPTPMQAAHNQVEESTGSLGDAKSEEAKCGDGKCGDGKVQDQVNGMHETEDQNAGDQHMEPEDKGGEGKCGDGKCGDADDQRMQHMDSEDKGGEGKCGDGKCGDGKCGDGSCGDKDESEEDSKPWWEQ